MRYNRDFNCIVLRAQTKKVTAQKRQLQPQMVEQSDDEEELAILEALERETEELDTARTNSTRKKKLRAYTEIGDDQNSEDDKSGPNSPTKVPQTRLRSTKYSEPARKSSKSTFEFEDNDEEQVSPRKKRHLPVAGHGEENDDSISDSEEKKTRSSPRKNKGPASKREKIKDLLQRYPRLSEFDNDDPFEDHDNINDVYEAAPEPLVVDVEKFNGRTMKHALETEDNDFELDNFLKETPKTKRQKQLAPLITKTDFGSRLGALSSRMQYYQNWDLIKPKEVIDIDEESQDSKKQTSVNDIGTYSPKNKSQRSVQKKLDFAPVNPDKLTSSSLARSSSSKSSVRKSPYFSSNQPTAATPNTKVKPKVEHDSVINNILSKYDDVDEGQHDNEIIDLSTQRPVSRVVNAAKNTVNHAVNDIGSGEENDFKAPKKEMEDFNDFDVESMLREVGPLGEDSEPKDSTPVIAIDESSLDGHKSSVSKNSSRKKFDTGPSSDNNSESSTTRDSKKRKRGSDERKQRALGTLNIIGAPEPSLRNEPPKKKRKLSEHIDR